MRLKFFRLVWRVLEDIIFVGSFFYIAWAWYNGLFQYLVLTFQGKGFIEDFTRPMKTHEYYNVGLSVVALMISVFTVWEIALLVIEGARREREKFGSASVVPVFRYVAKCFKPTFLAAMISDFLPRVIMIDIFWKVQPIFQNISLIKINFAWYSWIYAYLVWELSTWVWHYSTHRVRVLCYLHSPHHAPEDLTITTAWVHFFAEGYYTAFVQWFILSLLGVQPTMLVAIMAIEVTWGTFIHAGERSLKTGRLGVLKHILITPSHHRVHHAKNPLYMDTNFCTFLPFWDWVFGTLQPLRSEVKIEYGITRKIDITSFMDFYFGEFRLLYQDIRREQNIKNKFLFLVKPPGWLPNSREHTAALVRRNFLQKNPALGETTRRFFRRRRPLSANVPISISSEAI
jgi:sterol desaturase/sphingolipid hydroxylase (fatty acid hydroxylase superfamily)